MSNEHRPNRNEQEAMVDYIVDAVIGDATGASDAERCVGEPPSAKYYLSALAPRDLNLSADGSARPRHANIGRLRIRGVEGNCVLGLSAQ